METKEIYLCEQEICNDIFTTFEESTPEEMLNVRKKLGVSSNDELCVLSVHPNFMESDEEGWEYKSHFPAYTSMQVIEVTEGFVSYCVQIDCEFGTFIGLQNAHPFVVFGRKNKNMTPKENV